MRRLRSARRRTSKGKRSGCGRGDPLAEAFLKAANVSPVPLPITDVMTSLQTGLISSVYVSRSRACAAVVHAGQNCDRSADHPHAMGAVVISNAAWGQGAGTAPPEVRALCDQYFDKLRSAAGTGARSAEVIAESNVQTVTADPAEVARFRALGQSVAEELKGSLYSADLAPDQSAVAEARAGGRSRNEQP
ncbi:MAG: TRAP transporter substrate-binding protein DctP [Candidatus Eisenbacteria bacterium]